MFRTSLTLLATVALASFAQAQIVTFGGNTKRDSSNVMFFEQSAQKFLGGFAITYGSGAWKDDYAKMIGAEKDAVMRFGANDWATFTTSVPLTFGGVEVAPGQYNLGFAAKGGTMHLALLDAEHCRKHKTPPWQPGLCKKMTLVPLALTKGKKAADMLSVTVEKDSFTLNWGPHQLNAKIVATLPTTKGDKKGAR